MATVRDQQGPSATRSKQYRDNLGQSHSYIVAGRMGFPNLDLYRRLGKTESGLPTLYTGRWNDIHLSSRHRYHSTWIQRPLQYCMAGSASWRYCRSENSIERGVRAEREKE